MRLILYSQNEGTPEDLRSVLLNHSTNGVVWYSGPVPNEVREMIRSTHISFVSVFSDSPGLSSIKVDDFSSEYRLLYHLYELGHRAIAYVGKPLGNRWDAFRKFLQDYDLGPPRILAITDGKNAINIQTFRDHLMNNGLDFTAAVAQSDTTAVAFLSILHHHGIAVPGQVSLAGYDDFPIALECNPPLTTVRQNYSEMARTVTQYLLHSIETGERELFEKVFIHDIVLRASTASP